MIPFRGRGYDRLAWRIAVDQDEIELVEAKQRTSLGEDAVSELIDAACAPQGFPRQ
ncbi:MAG: hypothetical protein ACREQ1_02575 [Woeseiaceae bacterium]